MFFAQPCFFSITLARLWIAIGWAQTEGAGGDQSILRFGKLSVPLCVPLSWKKHFVLERQAKNQFRIENTEETLCGKKPDEGPRNSRILNFKSCASAIFATSATERLQALREECETNSQLRATIRATLMA